jgi:AhpD family alkylhydroperoxidase
MTTLPTGLEPRLAADRSSGPILSAQMLRRWLPPLVRRSPDLLTAYVVPGRVDPRIREAAMLGVTSVNRCAACQAVHDRWGRAVGLEANRLTPDEAAAFAFGQELAVTGPGQAHPSDDLEPRHRRELEATAIAMELANLAGNRFEAARQRRHGRHPAARSGAEPERTSRPRQAPDAAGARALDLVMAGLDRAGVARARGRVAGAARGDVLEIGIGSGRNLHVYPADTTVHGIDPSAAVLALAEARGRDLGREPTLAIGDAGRLPYPDASFDTVVATFVLCSVDDVDGTLREARRVLRPGGTVRLLEHARSHHPRLARAQRALAPAWARAAGGCRLDHDVRQSVRAAGFRVVTERRRAGGILVEQVVTA